MPTDPPDLPDASLPVGLSAAGWSAPGPVGPPAPGTPSGPVDEAHPFALEEAGRYERRQLLGRGGMGRVVVAFDRRLRREVALKELAEDAGGASEGGRRLAQEAWITAQLDHPGIVPVLDAGRTADGKLFYTMPIVRGRSLAEVLAAGPDPAARRALLPRLLSAAQAVAHAHAAGIVHRDLKPANILLGALGEVQVADWGLARSTREAEPAWRRVLPALERTAAHEAAVRGTPAYMSPEQANGLEVGPTSDVWSLGVVLQEAVTGVRPFSAGTPSAVLAAVRRAVPAPLPESCPAELRAIIERALSAEPAERYPDARALAADLERYLSGQRVAAHDYTPAELLRRAVRAWRVPLAVAGVALLSVAVVSGVLWQGTVTERDRARAAEASLTTSLDDNAALLARALVLQAEDALADQSRANAEVLAARALQLREDPRARGVLAAVGGRPRPVRAARVALPESCLRRVLPDSGPDLLCIEPERITAVDLATGEQRWERAAQAMVAGVSRDGGSALVLLGSMAATRLDLETGAMRRIKRPRSGARGLAAGPGPGQGVLHNSDGLEPLPAVPAVDGRFHWCPGVEHEALASTDDALFVMCADGRLASGPLAESPENVVQTDVGTDRAAPSSMAVSPDGAAMAVATRDGELMLLSLADGRTTHREPLGIGPLSRVRWSPDGGRLLVTSSVGPAVVWSVTAEAVLAQLPADRAPLGRWEADGSLRLVGDTGVSRWVLPEDGRPHRLPQQSGVSSVDVSDDGRHLATCRGDGRMRVLSLDDFSTVATAARPGRVCKDVVFSADGSQALGVYAQATGLRVDLRVEGGPVWGDVEGRFRRVLSLAPGSVVGLRYGQMATPIGVHGAPDDRLGVVDAELVEGDDAPGRRFAVALDRDGRVLRFEGGADAAVRTLFDEPAARALDISSDGARVAIARDAGKGVVVRAADDGRVLRTLDAGARRHTEVAWSADGRWLAVGDMSGETQLFRDDATAPVAILPGHRHLVSALAFTPDSGTLVTGSWDGDLRLWDLASIERDPDALLSEATGAWGTSAEALLGR